jgi:hypothetical protein
MSAKQPAPRPSKHQLTRHHRRPRFYNGGVSKNISMVPRNQHEAFHTLFAWGFPARMVCWILNVRWLCASEVVIPIPTKDIPRVLKYLRSHGIPISEAEIGLTHLHREIIDA